MHCRRYQSIPLISRRHWLLHTGLGLGGIALATMDRLHSGGAPAGRLPHFAPKAKRVICLFMSGGVSQVDSFDHKPVLNQRRHEPLPDSILKGRKPLGMSKLQSVFPIEGSAFSFSQHGQSGAWFSECFPRLARHADRLCFLKGMVSEAVNHDPAIIFINSGSQLPGRPSLGAWLSYGLGSENNNLPSFIVLVTKKPVDQPLSSRLWDSGFLPTQHQAVQFRSGKEPVLYLKNPDGLPPALHRTMLDQLGKMQQDEFMRRGHPDILARAEQYEMAYRMQMAVPETTDLSREPSAVLDSYGPDAKMPGSFAYNCLLARRLSESGVRFIQLYHPGWDHHSRLNSGFKASAREVDQPVDALLSDLHERGLMKDTLVLFLTEFGRTPYSQGGLKDGSEYGREHHKEAFTCWMTGAGVKPGITHGITDEFGFDVIEGRTTVNDLHATVLHLLGIEHTRFTFPFQGRDFRLTDVAGELVAPVLA